MRKLLIPLFFLAAIGCSTPKSTYEQALDPNPANMNGDVVLDQIALDLKDDLSAEDIKQLGKDYGIVLHDNSPESHALGNIEIASVSSDEESSLLARLSKDPRVEIAEPVIMAHAYFTPNDPMYAEQWGMSKIGMDTAWNYSCGTGATIAIVDTGITAEDYQGYKALSDLKDLHFVPGYNFITPSMPPVDDQGHGSHCAGTAAGATNNAHGVAGVAHCARIMPVKVLASNGSGSMSGVAEGIRWAADHGANIISLSLGSSGNSDIVAKAVAYAHDKGVFLSCAAGNSGGSVGFPAANKGCIAVSATDQNDNLATFSSRGKEVAIGAPGVAILQQTISEGGKGVGSFEKFNGTSMATPAVSGAAALLYSQGITDPDDILVQLQSSAIEKQDQTKFGAGILNAGDATKNYWMKTLLTRLGFLALFSFLTLTILKKNRLSIDPHPAKFLGAALASVGILFFLPLTGLLPHLGSFRWVGEILSRPLGEWDMVIDNSLHKWMILGSAVPTFILVAFGHHNRVIRSLAGGIAVGTAAYLAQVVLSGNSQFILGSVALRAWSMVNIVALLWVGKNTLLSQSKT